MGSLARKSATGLELSTPRSDTSCQMTNGHRPGTGIEKDYKTHWSTMTSGQKRLNERILIGS
jgi:hypothetical protein